MARASSRAKTYWLFGLSFSQWTSWPASWTSACLGGLDVVEHPLARRLAAPRVLEIEVDDDLEPARAKLEDGRNREALVGSHQAPDDGGVELGEAVGVALERPPDGWHRERRLERTNPPLEARPDLRRHLRHLRLHDGDRPFRRVAGDPLDLVPCALQAAEDARCTGWRC